MEAISNPQKIETRSFEIIDGLLKGIRFPGCQKDVVKRVIHTTTDLRYAKDLLFSDGAVRKGLKALREGASIIVDSSMVMAGLNKKITLEFNNKIICLINDRDVVRESSQSNLTRAIVAMRKVSREMGGAIIAIGNAPTALFEICDLVNKQGIMPALVVGVPVGFVGAKESKKKLRSLGAPYITNKSRRGGSTVAAAIVNSLLILAKG
jgi:precorrin-8X/cobalt-precorrin-8 methylmutase